MTINYSKNQFSLSLALSSTKKYHLSSIYSPPKSHMQLKAPLTKLITNTNKINTWIPFTHTYIATLIAAAASNNYNFPLLTSSSMQHIPLMGTKTPLITSRLPPTYLSKKERPFDFFLPTLLPEVWTHPTAIGKCSPTLPSQRPPPQRYPFPYVV